MKNTLKNNQLLFAFMIAGGTFLAACGNGTGTHSDTTTVGGVENGTVTPDTAPSAEIPPGAINPGEDSSRYGTGTADSSKNRQQ
ncbi:hypothetical protein [Chitinophaga agri]|uniref:Uncharacterized protein n=1 Tax=Chitinophaga agri TaxID=2703787 RepID=A0A6B9ZA36_9BACT|nr:hypothetical protein [Chitinophaga agri]QHS58729.1 hypothetical protein GWR21_03665 [Chitinophaga agri]